jgi:biotin carboxyl carrier protein
VGERELEAELRVVDGAVLVRLDGVEHRVGYRRSSDGGLRLLQEGGVTRAWSDGRAACVAGESLAIERGRAGGTTVPGSLAAPMPATVVAVKVAVGERVVAGQVCVVVSAMKTEMSLRAPRDGVVAELRVAVGASVRAQEETVRLADPGPA